MDIQIIEKKEMKVIGIPWNGTYSQVGSISRLFDEFAERAEEIIDQSNEPVFIAPFHCRETEFTYYITKPVKQITYVPDGMVGFTIPAKNYIYATHSGSTSEVENTYLKILSWMREYGYEQDHQALSLEIYDEDFKTDSSPDSHLFLEIYIPVKKY
ncbi:MAG: GyrI-like domain-containing protein [Bacillota bacterium]|nr:GyrI-like domain-containing protein [Bacillota bacterium]